MNYTLRIIKQGKGIVLADFGDYADPQPVTPFLHERFNEYKEKPAWSSKCSERPGQFNDGNSATGLNPAAHALGCQIYPFTFQRAAGFYNRLWPAKSSE